MISFGEPLECQRFKTCTVPYVSFIASAAVHGENILIGYVKIVVAARLSPFCMWSFALAAVHEESFQCGDLKLDGAASLPFALSARVNTGSRCVDSFSCVDL